MSELKWEAPPEKGRRVPKPSAHWVAVAEELRSRPGEWAVVSEDSSASLATQIKDGTNRAFAGGGFEAVSREIPGSSPRRSRIWARYIGVQP